MDKANIITQIQEGKNKRDYRYRCCGCEDNTFYEFRKHLYDCHKEEYPEFVPFMHRELPPQMSKEERMASARKALKRKKLSKKGKKVREKVDYSKQPTAWIVYNHNGPKR